MKYSKRQNRKKILPDRLFALLWNGAEKNSDKSEYIRKYTLPGSEEYIEFSKKYGIEYEDAIILLNEIFEKNKMTVKEILALAGKKKAEAASAFCVPIRTMEDWYAGKSGCASYIRLAMLRQYHLLNLGKYIYIQAEEEYRNTFPDVYKKREINKKEESQEEELEEIDDFLQNIRKKRENMLSMEQNESQSVLERTSFIDEILHRTKQKKQNTE